MMFWGHHMTGYGLLFAVVLWIGLIVLGIWLLARLFPRVGNAAGRGSGVDAGDRSRMPTVDGPMEILQKRYARGELTKEEYETIRHDLAS